MKKEKTDGKYPAGEIGFVASGSRPQNMKFYSMGQIDADCVVIELEEGERAVYEVTDVDAYNSRMEDMELVRYILPGEDYTKYTVYRANAKPLGVIRGGELHSMRRWFVAPPGGIVKAAESQEIALVYGVERQEGKQRIGSVLRHETIPVWLDMTGLLTTHMALVGRSGQGKSNLAKILLKDLPMKYMVFTKVNEYTSVQNTKMVDLKQVTVSRNLGLLKKIFDFSNSELQYLRDYLKNSQIPECVRSADLAEEIRCFYGKPSEESFQQMDLFGEQKQGLYVPLPKFVESLCKKLESISLEICSGEELGEAEESSILNLQNLSDREGELMLYSYLAPMLEKRRRYYENTGQPVPLNERIVIFLEEAHNYIPSTKSAFCKEVIQKIAREGRKLGIHLVLLSQRPRHIDPTALSQCGSIISFNLTNPEDIDYLMKNANFYGDQYRNTISDLKIGECTIVSDYLMRAINCKVDFEQA